VTVARTLTDSFTGIEPADAPWFVVAQLLGATAAVGVGRVLFAKPAPTLEDTLAG
jgi:hypothetical protein